MYKQLIKEEKTQELNIVFYIENTRWKIRIIFNSLTVMQQPNKHKNDGNDAKQMSQNGGTVRTHLASELMQQPNTSFCCF